MAWPALEESNWKAMNLMVVGATIQNIMENTESLTFKHICYVLCLKQNSLTATHASKPLSISPNYD